MKSSPQEGVLHQGKPISDSVQYYFEQARLGIGDAYVRMAQYYLDGRLGKPNLLKAVTMGFMAEEYMAIPNVNALFRDVPDSDATKIAYHALDMLNQVEDEDTLMAKAYELLNEGIPEGYVMKAIIAWKKGKKDKAMLLCDKTTGNGSTIADVLKDIIQGDTIALLVSAEMKAAEKLGLQKLSRIVTLREEFYRNIKKELNKNANK